ncbi:hypothetical protein [Streptomyces sp. NBRC 109706]|uniref:hypothetical protein n=1 Tax=Streptomyces sp. NBRC 109706 TaxID=1550035 RepID=UPI0007845804|nr:hypothetical protein [Streptomyces sp. NBRC 109706]
MTEPIPAVGRCQRCQQLRPVWRLDAPAAFWNDARYTTPTGAWLCARHYSDATTTHEDGQAYTVEHDLEVFPWETAPLRVFTPSGEVLTESDRDLAACRAILAATDGAAS